MAARNPTWTFEELVLAYKTYLDLEGEPSSIEDPAVQELSAQLRALAEDAGVEISDTFRNPAGVNMKLRNLEGAESEGTKGLKYTKREQEVVEHFGGNRKALDRAASLAAAGRKVWMPSTVEGVPAGYTADKLAAIKERAVAVAQDPLFASAVQVEPHTRSLGGICHDERALRIPRHQRSYAWTDDEVEEFASDIQDLAMAVAADKKDPQHFFGGLVMVRTVDQTGWDIIDGQQRITTFAISLAVLQAAFEHVALVAQDEGDIVTGKAGTNYAEKLRDEFLWTRQVDPRTGDSHKEPRFTPNEKDAKAFAAILEGKSLPAERESQKLLVEARDLLLSQLTAPILASPKSAKQMLRALVALQFALLKCCIVIQLSATDPGAAYRLFMVLNDRGLDLSEGDLLRAITLEALDQFRTQQRAAAELWDQILGEPSDDIKAFLRSYYPSVYGKRIDIWKVVDVYRDEVFETQHGAVSAESQARAVVRRLAAMQEELLTYKQLRAGEWPLELPSGSKGYAERVRRLVKTLKHDLATPLLLAAATRLTPHQFGKLVILVERFAFRYKNIGRGHAGKAADAYYAHARYIRALPAGKRYSMSGFRDELRELIEASDNDELFVQELRERLDYSQAGQRGNIRWLLAAIEDFGPWLGNSKRKGEPELSHSLVFDVESAHIDHVYPQNPRKGEGDSSLDEVKHALGNLVLLEEKPNTIAGNTPFAAKRSFYTKSRLSETKTVGRKHKWTAAAVEKREQQLAAAAVLLTDL